MTLFVSINNAGSMIPNTIGLKLVSKVDNYVLFVVVVLLISGLFMAYLRPICMRVDSLDKERFLLSDENLKQDSIISSAEAEADIEE